MATACVVLQAADLGGSVCPLRETLDTSRTGWDSETVVDEHNWTQRSNEYLYAHAGWRHSYTAMDEGRRGPSIWLPILRSWRLTLRRLYGPCTETLPQQSANTPSSLGSLPSLHESAECLLLSRYEDELARACYLVDAGAPVPHRVETPKSVEPPIMAPSAGFDIDFHDNTGVQTRGKKAAKKAAKVAQQSKWFDDDPDEKKNDEGGEEGGGGDGNGAGGDATGGGGGGGDEGGDGNGGGDDDDWNFGGGNKKDKKKKKKQQEEEEKKKQEEEEAAAAAASNPDPLSWADETNNANDDDWTTGFSTKKDKKKKKKGADEAPPAVPDAPPTSAFQDISLDDGAPKLDFTFDSGDTKKGSSFGNWGTTWDFGSGDKSEDKKPKKEELADNNPWSLGNSKSKKQTNISSDFDFGDFGTKNNDIGFGAAGDIGDTKTVDDSWGFSTGKKDKKKKKGAFEEEPVAAPAPEPEPVKEEEPWGAWGTAASKKDKKKTKKGVIEEPVPEPVPDPPAPETEPVDTFDWGFGGTKKDKKKKSGLISEVKDEPAPEPEKAADEDDWMGGWSTGAKKKDKKGKKGADEVSPPPPAPEPVNEETDFWASLEKKDKKSKKGKASELDLEPEPTPVEPEPEPAKEEELPWDYGLSAKERKKKEKELKKKGIDPYAKPEPVPEPAPEPEPEPTPEPEVKEDDSWATWGLSAKDKKKKEKEKETKKKGLISPIEETPISPALEPEADTSKKADDLWGTWGMTSKEKKKKDKESVKSKLLDPDPEPIVEPEPEPAKEETVDESWGSWGLSSKDKKKKEKEAAKKKGMLSPTEEKPVEEFKSEQPPEDDIWGTITSAKDKKGKKKKGFEEPPPPVPTPPAQGLSPETSPTKDLDADPLDDDAWGGLTTGKASKKKAVKEEPVEEKTSNIWGFGTSTKAKTKKEKEKEAKAKKEAEEQAAREAEEAAAREEEEKLKREAEEAAAAAAAEVAAKSAKKKTTKSAKSSSSKLLDEKKKSVEDATIDLLDDPAPEATEEKADDYFGSWGSTWGKKTTGKKEKEITKSAEKGSTNKNATLVESTKALEPWDDDVLGLPSPKSSKATTSKTKVGSSIAERIKALESKNAKDESTAGKKNKLSEDAAAQEPEVALSPKEEKKASKSKTSTKVKQKDIDSPASPIIETDAKKSKDSVPGSFPDAFGDDLLAEEDPEPVAKKSTKLDKKAAKSKSSKPTKASPEVEEKPVIKTKDLVMDDLLDLDSPKLPTPPPEEKKTAKKERARVERTGNTASWGFWGAAPPPAKKKEASKVKDVGDVSPTTDRQKTPSATKVKTSRTRKEPEKDESRDGELKSSGSDQETKSKGDKAKASRGLSFSQFMLGGAPPSAMRAKPGRRSSVTGTSRASSRRPSVDVGLASPPPERDLDMTDKAAKVMGVKSKVERRTSVKSKSKAYADPYPIDDDDMVMINTPKSPEPPEEKKLRSKVDKARRASTKPRSKTMSGDEDVVMVDGPTAEAGVTSGPDDLVHVETPPLQRGNSIKKAAGFFGGFFAARQIFTEPKPVSPEAEEPALPIRSNPSTKRRSKVPEDGGFTTDAPMETDADVEIRRAERKAKREARRQAEEDERVERDKRRRERREREQADLDARRARARESTRRQEEQDEADREARRERRRQKQAERERVVQEEQEMSAAADKRREERKRLRAELEAANPDVVVSKEERRRNYIAEEEERRTRREERKVKDRSSRRRSTALVEEYDKTRSGRGKGTAPPANKTSSWVASQNDEPPEPPPVEGTILDPSGEKPRSAEEFDSGQGGRRRRDKYAGMSEAEIEEHRARRRARRAEKEKSNSAEGGSDERRRSRKDYDPYAEQMRTFDGRPATQRENSSKRNSFLGRFF